MKKELKLEIEELEERIAPSFMNAAHAMAEAHSPVTYQGDGLHTPGHTVPQDNISGSGFDSAGKADFNGSLVRVFGHSGL